MRDFLWSFEQRQKQVEEVTLEGCHRLMYHCHWPAKYNNYWLNCNIYSPLSTKTVFRIFIAFHIFFLCTRRCNVNNVIVLIIIFKAKTVGLQATLIAQVN